MRVVSFVVVIAGLFATLVAAPVSAQQPQNATPPGRLHVNDGFRSSVFEPPAGLTEGQFEAFTAELGTLLRFRQVGDPTTVAARRIEIGVQFANTPFDDARVSWSTADHRIGRSVSYPQVVARFGISDRVDIGAWAAFDPRAKYGLGGVDTKVAVLKQGSRWPVSVSVRPSFASLVSPLDLWVGTVSIDASVSRAVGRLTPYVGVSANSSLGIETAEAVNLQPVSAGRTTAYAGASYRWQSLVLSAEVERGTRLNYAFRVATRF